MRSTRCFAPLLVMLTLAACQNVSDRDRYPVFFEQNSVALTEPAHTIIRYAALDAKKQGARHVQVIGRASASRNLSADELLAMKRASNVAQALADEGVNPRIISQEARAPKNRSDAAVSARTVTIEIDP